MDEVIHEFLVEAQENMEAIYKNFSGLEKDPESQDLIAGTFRSIHSIKGASGFFNFSTLEGIAHFCEDILSKVRDGKFPLTPDRHSILVEGVDAVDKIISNLVESGVEGDADYVDLVMRLRDASQREDGSVPKSKSPKSKSDENVSENGTTTPETSEPAKTENAEEESTEKAQEQHPEEERPPAPAAEDPPGDTESVSEDIPAPASPAAETTVPVSATPPNDPKVESAPAANSPAAEAKGPATASMAESSIRVDVSLLDKLMNLVEELVLSRNQIVQFSNVMENNDLTNACQVFSLVTSELQEGIMKTRMQPVSTVLNKFPRIVRDMARACEKEINFKLEGEETELDKTIIEAIKDPLTHIIRNSVDHGIEKPADRLAAGKPESGKLLIRAFHEGGQVVIEIIDDGSGINSEKVKAKAIESGVVSLAQANEMPPHEINQLIFRPGFSTVEVVTNLSGRGVGMDVVKTNIEKIGGVVDLFSEMGKGTTLRIRIPLTLAIVPALIVSSAGDRFAIPQVNLLELVRMEDEGVASRIERVGEAQTYRLRGQLLPLIHLKKILSLDAEKKEEENGFLKAEAHEEPHVEADGQAGLQNQSNTGLNILVLASGETQFGLIVEEVHDIEEVVVKALSKHVSSVSAYAGATILGDGKVVLILDASGLAEQAHMTMEVVEGVEGTETDEAVADKLGQDSQSLLLFSVAPDEQFAVPLALVSRLEKFPRSGLGLAGGKEVIQYRGRILPLLRLENQLAISSPLPTEDDLNVVVFNFEEKEVGLIVTEILDVVDTSVEMDQKTFDRPAILGSGITNDRTTLFIDIFSVVERNFPTWFEKRQTPLSIGNGSQGGRILIVEDSPFFRTLTRSYLESAGYRVTEAGDGEEALAELEKDGGNFDLLVTDIEMPRMNGFELTERVRSSGRWEGMPIMALTALASDEDRERGKRAGVDDYRVKIDREEVLDAVDRRLKKGAASNKYESNEEEYLDSIFAVPKD